MEDNAKDVKKQDDGGQGGNGGNQPQSQTQQDRPQTPEFDYEKLAGLVAGKQTVAEDTVLKNYFKQQGLSEGEVQQAISQFKQQKAASQPDVGQIQQQMMQARNAAQEAQLQSAAMMAAVELGIDAKTIPYVLKMADLASAVDKDGKINGEAVKTAVSKVLEDVPQLKPAAADSRGFQIGGSGSTQSSPPEKTNTNPVPAKRWNRFNN